MAPNVGDKVNALMDQIIEERKRSKQESIQKEIEYIKLQNNEMEERLEAPMESSDDEEG